MYTPDGYTWAQLMRPGGLPLFPNWLGQTQPRVKIDGEMLHLSATAPIQSGGKQTMSYLTWGRVEAGISS
jgi:hypothetical protein